MAVPFGMEILKCTKQLDDEMSAALFGEPTLVDKVIQEVTMR